MKRKDLPMAGGAVDQKSGQSRMQGAVHCFQMKRGAAGHRGQSVRQRLPMFEVRPAWFARALRQGNQFDLLSGRVPEALLTSRNCKE